MKKVQREDCEALAAELRKNMFANSRLHIANRLMHLQRDYWRNVAKQFIDEIDIENNHSELRELLRQNGFIEYVEIID